MVIGAENHAVRMMLDVLGSNYRLTELIGDPWSTLRLTTAFLVGACFYLFRNEVFQRLSGRVAALTGGTTAILLFHDPHIAEVALITLGAVALFWLGFKANLGPIQQVNDRWDISYGVYLYGWPIATAIRWFDRGISPWALIATTLPLALLAGMVNWWGLEKWTKDFARSWSSQGSPKATFRWASPNN